MKQKETQQLIYLCFPFHDDIEPVTETKIRKL